MVRFAERDAIVDNVLHGGGGAPQRGTTWITENGGAIEAAIFTKLAADTRSFFPLPAGYGTGV